MLPRDHEFPRACGVIVVRPAEVPDEVEFAQTMVGLGATTATIERNSDGSLGDCSIDQRSVSPETVRALARRKIAAFERMGEGPRKIVAEWRAALGRALRSTAAPLLRTPVVALRVRMRRSPRPRVPRVARRRRAGVRAPPDPEPPAKPPSGRRSLTAAIAVVALLTAATFSASSTARAWPCATLARLHTGADRDGRHSRHQEASTRGGARNSRDLHSSAIRRGTGAA